MHFSGKFLFSEGIQCWKILKKKHFKVNCTPRILSEYSNFLINLKYFIVTILTSVFKVKILRAILDGFWVRAFIVAWWKVNFALTYTHKTKMIHCEWGRLDKHHPTWDERFLGVFAYSMKTDLKSFNVSRLFKTQIPSWIFFMAWTLQQTPEIWQDNTPEASDLPLKFMHV